MDLLEDSICFYTKDKLFFTKKILNLKNRLEIGKFYNLNDSLSSIYYCKKNKRKGLFIFYCNNFSNLNRIHLNIFAYRKFKEQKPYYKWK